MTQSLLSIWRKEMQSNKVVDASLYNITVRKGNFDGEIFFEAKVKELPDVAEYADTYEEAYLLAIDAIETTAEMFAELDKIMPLPIIEENEHSGRITLRMPKSMHAAYASWSESEETSLNQLIINCLSFSLGEQFGALYMTQESRSERLLSSLDKPFPKFKRKHTPIKRVHDSSIKNQQVAYGKNSVSKTKN